MLIHIIIRIIYTHTHNIYERKMITTYMYYLHITYTYLRQVANMHVIIILLLFIINFA